jgi:hypothetical protein
MPITNFDKVELLLPMTGANNGTTFTDYSMRQRTVTRTGAITSTGQSKFAAYGSSGEFIGAEYLTIPHAAGFMFPDGTDFTIEGYFRFNSVASNKQLVSKWSGTASAANWTFQWVQSSAQLIFNFRAADGTTYVAAIDRSWSPSANTWYHLAVTRSGTDYRLFVDGVQLGATASVATGINQATSSAVEVGRTNGAAVNNDMYSQDVMITSGDAKYIENFTPPLRMTQRTLTRTNTGTDSHEYDRAVLFDWNGSQNAVGHTGGGFVVPDSEGDFVADDLIDLEYGVVFIKDGCGPICRGPVEVDPDA